MANTNFFNVHGTFIKKDHILGQRSALLLKGDITILGLESSITSLITTHLFSCYVKAPLNNTETVRFFK